MSEFVDGALEFPIVLCWDATGFGKLQLCTAALFSPWESLAAAGLHILGLGNCDDGRSGVKRVLGPPNVTFINRLIEADQKNELVPLKCPAVPSGEVKLRIPIHVTNDTSALRHGEHLANSGWCMCSADCLRKVPIRYSI